MQQTNKFQRILSVGIFCASLVMFAGLTSCSKEAVNEEAPLTKGMPGGAGTITDPYLPGNCPLFDFHESGFHYFSMDTKKCSFRVVNPAKTNAMVIKFHSRSGQKSYNVTMRRFPSQSMLAGNSLSFSTNNASVELRIPPTPCGPNENPNPVLPAEEVIVTIEGSETYTLGVGFTYKIDPVKPTPPYPGQGSL